MASRALFKVLKSCNSIRSLAQSQQFQHVPSKFHSLMECRQVNYSKGVPYEASQPRSFMTILTHQLFGFSTSSSSGPANEESTKSADPAHASKTDETKHLEDSSTPTESSKAEESSEAHKKEDDIGLDSKSEDPKLQSVKKRRRRSPKRSAFSDSDGEPDLSKDEIKKLLREKEEFLKLKDKEIEKMRDKVLRSYAEMENVLDRTKREAENSKKFAIQNFAKSLLDVADNLARASSVVKESFSKIDSSKDTVGAVPLLKTLLEGVEMTEKQLVEVFRKYGVEKFDPLNENFDPNRHHAVFQIPDASKEPGTVAAVLKPGYMLHDRVLRPAEVGVTEALNNQPS